MNVHFRRSLSNGLQNVYIRLPGIVRMNPALQTNLCRAQLGGLNYPAMQLFGIYVISSAIRYDFTTALGKSTKAAAELANVGVIDVAIDHIGDCITYLTLS